MYNNFSADYKNTKKKREPTCTLKEFTAVNGLTYSVIYKRLNASECAPQVKFKNKMNKYYSMTELKRWHKEEEEKRQNNRNNTKGQ